MAFKSQAQRERALKLVKDGKLTSAEFDKWNEGTPKKIPVRVKPKKVKK